MISADFVRVMAAYNVWQNDGLYAAAEGLGEDARRVGRGAFFGSIHGTCNHLLWGDRIWMSRFADTQPPNSPGIPGSTAECDDWEELRAARRALDVTISAWADGLTAERLAGDMTWFSASVQRDVTKPLWLLIVHFHNHQTHHRGQIHAMLTAAGAKPGDTDLFLLPDTPA